MLAGIIKFIWGGGVWLFTNYQRSTYLLLAVFLFSLGWFSHGVWQDIGGMIDDYFHNKWADEVYDSSVAFEADKAEITNNERKVRYASKDLDGDCRITADRLRTVNAALTNDTSKLPR